ncbi:MAG: hypothetical protein JST92_24560 [Deltaproteobacteria bacterium]|nr:hypothetical protein [Deltaproteobacteria bacterium]
MHRSLTVAAALALVLLATPAHAVKVYENADQGTNLNVGVLLQPQAQVTLDGAPTGTDPAFDFFARRARVLVYGTAFKKIGWFLETDEPNFGKKGDFTGQFFVQDAWVWYQIAESMPTYIDAGMMLLPFSHNGLQSAASLNTIDYHSGVIKYNSAKVFRDFGVQLRGFLLDKAIHYRLGIFNGTDGVANTVGAGGAITAAGKNTKDLPMFVGQVRYNIMGSEDGFFFAGVGFAEKPVINVGVSGLFQTDAGVSSTTGTPATAVYNNASAFNADAYVDYPLEGDMAITAQLAFFHYDNGPNASTTGNGGFIEAGFRYSVIEPVVGFDFFNSDEVDGAPKKGSLRKWTAGVNYFVAKNTANVKLEVSGTRSGDPGTAKNVKAVTIQSQLFF